MTFPVYHTMNATATTTTLPLHETFTAISEALPAYTHTLTTNRRRASCQDCGRHLEPGTGIGWTAADLPGARTFYLCGPCDDKAIIRIEQAPLISAALAGIRAWAWEHMTGSAAGCALMKLETIFDRCGEHGGECAEMVYEWLPALEANPSYDALVGLARQCEYAFCGGPVEGEHA